MKFSEVIAELERNPEKKFKHIFVDGKDTFTYIMSIPDSEYFMLEVLKNGIRPEDNPTTGMYGFNGNITINDAWQEIRPSIEVGDKVKVVDAGERYSNYSGWFEENKVNTDIAARYQYSVYLSSEEDLGKKAFRVVAKGKHSLSKNMLYAIEEKYSGKVYLIGEEGIEKVEE